MEHSAVHCTPDPDGSCSICSDEAVPATVLVVDTLERTAEVAHPGGVTTVALDLIGEVSPGDQLLVQLGFALARIQSHALPER